MELNCISRVFAYHDKIGTMVRFLVVGNCALTLFEVTSKDGVYLNETVADVCEYLHLHREAFSVSTNNLGIMMWVRKPGRKLPERKLTIHSKG